MFSIFKKPPILDDEIVLWLFDTYRWSLTNFNAQYFYSDTQLILPNNSYFSGEENTAEGMAKLIFSQVKKYAGMSHWPCDLVDENEYVPRTPPKIAIKGPIRGNDLVLQDEDSFEGKFVVTYNRFQLNDPEVLIASYAHTLAFYLGLMAETPPPGGKENLPHATELLAIFMGFGVIMANSANTRKIRSCGSCSGPAVERANYLSEFDTCYALAIFSTLKKIDQKNVISGLKKTLRPFYKNALKDVNNRQTLLDQLAQIEGDKMLAKPSQTSSS